MSAVKKVRQRSKNSDFFDLRTVFEPPTHVFEPPCFVVVVLNFCVTKPLPASSLLFKRLNPFCLLDKDNKKLNKVGLEVYKSNFSIF